MTAPNPQGEGPAPVAWAETRKLFVREAERFMNASRYEEASAIADAAARDIEALYAAPAPDLAGRERVARLLDRIVEECGNTGFGNPIVNERMIDRIHDDAVEAQAILALIPKGG